MAGVGAGYRQPKWPTDMVDVYAIFSISAQVLAADGPPTRRCGGIYARPFDPNISSVGAARPPASLPRSCHRSAHAVGRSVLPVAAAAAVATTTTRYIRRGTSLIEREAAAAAAATAKTGSPCRIVLSFCRVIHSLVTKLDPTVQRRAGAATVPRQ